MPGPRTPKSLGGSRDGSGEDSDATVDPTPSVQTRRTRKRPAHLARQGSEDQCNAQPAIRPHTDLEQDVASATETEAADRRIQALRHHHADRRNSSSRAAHANHLASASAFETPNQARDRLALMQSSSSVNLNSNITETPRQSVQNRPARNSRPNAELRLSMDQTNQNGIWTSTSLASGLSSRSSSSRREENIASDDLRDSPDAPMTPVAHSSEPVDQSATSGPLALRSRNTSSQSQLNSASSSNAPMIRTSSNMSPPRPTRSLPRRRASARTQSRPLLSSSNSASSSYALRSRSTSSSNILASSSSTANILASSQNNRQNLVMGCMPLGGGFDPNYNPPSGMSTPRTPLAEIPLWLADMRSESRRSSTSSSSFLDRDEFLSATRSASSRHARTVSTSSSGPSSPGATRNGSTSPVIPFRRSLRGRRPRQSDENARISPSPSYFGEYDALPSPSSASVRGESMSVDQALDANASLSSSMIHLGTSSPSTPSVHLQTSSPAMSTRSRTLNRAGSMRNRRMTNPLNTPVSAQPTGLVFEPNALHSQESFTALHQSRQVVQHEHTRNGNEPRSVSLLERRAAAAAAAAAVAPASSHPITRSSSRPTSRTSSPARGTRASRRRSTAAEGQASTAMENGALGPRPAQLPPLQIPGARAAHETGLMMLNIPIASSVIPEELEDGAMDRQHAAQMEPVSPSAFSEMTSLTQDSTASDSMNSAGGMPATPSPSTSALDPFSQTTMQEALLADAGGISSQVRRARNAVAIQEDLMLDESIPNRVLRPLASQRKPALSSRDAQSHEDASGIQLRPRP